MFRKITSLSVALIVAGGVMIAVPASAAVKVSNGVACNKAGATTKTSFAKYKCGKYALVSNPKLVWLSTDCIASANSVIRAEKAAVSTIAGFAAQIPIIDLGIAAETADRAVLQTKLDNANLRLPAAKLELDAAKVKLAAAVSLTDKATATKTVAALTTAVANWTAAVRAFTSLILNKEISIKKLEAAKLVAINKPITLAANVKDLRDGAKLICARGL